MTQKPGTDFINWKSVLVFLDAIRCCAQIRYRIVTTSKEGACPNLNHDPCIYTHLIP